MESDTDQKLRDALAALAAALDDVGAPYMLIGGFAVILRGVARQTVDIDATVWAERLDLDALLSVLQRYGIEGRLPDTAQFARAHQVLLLRHAASQTPMELSLAWLPFERTALGRAEPIEVAGVTIPVALVDDLLVYKAVAWRDRDRADIERLLIAHADRVDLSYVRGMVREFAELLDEPRRLKEFDRLLKRAQRRENP